MKNKGIKLPFRIAELDEDSPMAIQRNFSEIEYYLNTLKGGIGTLTEQISLLDFAPSFFDGEVVLPSEEEIYDVNPTLALVEYVLPGTGQVGSLDLDIKTNETGAIKEVWVMRVINRECIVEIYNDGKFETVFRSFAITMQNAGADVVDVSITFTGTFNEYGVFISEQAPNMFWVERTETEDKIYGLKWDGTNTMPLPEHLGSAMLSKTGLGQDANITV